MPSEIFTIYYIGRTRTFTFADEKMASCLTSDMEWRVQIPESALRQWFGFEVDPAGATTYYGVLGITRHATAEDIRTAYRRMAMQWHPDRCKESNAQETFLKVQEAYEVLGNGRREKYDAGLVLEESIKKADRKKWKQADLYGYRTPLRNGLIAGDGNWQGDKFIMRRIMAWADIVDPEGKTLVSSWVYGAKTPTLVWA